VVAATLGPVSLAFEGCSATAPQPPNARVDS